MTLEEKLQHFYDRSVEDAHQEGEAVLAEYQASLDKLLQEHKNEKELSAKNRVEAERAALLRDSNKELAGKQIKIRHELAEMQSEVKDEIFEEVRQQLIAFKREPRYRDWICKKIQLAKQVSGSDVKMEIYIDPSDEKLKASIEKETGEAVMISQIDFIGGVRIVIRSQRILMDDSFARLIEDAKADFSFEGGVRQ